MRDLRWHTRERETVDPPHLLSMAIPIIPAAARIPNRPSTLTDNGRVYTARFSDIPHQVQRKFHVPVTVISVKRVPS